MDTQAIRSKILDLAIRGKLTEQLPEDGTAEELYRQIKAEKQAIIKTGKTKKPLSAISADEIPFEVPANWKWVRLYDVTTTNIGLTYHPEDIAEDGTIVVRSCNIINSRMDYTDLVKVRCPIRNNQYLNRNDIVICARNGSKALVGKCAIYEGESGAVAFGAFMAVLRTPFYRYVFYYLHTDAFRRYFHDDDSKQINQVTQDILKEALIPLPPVAEQHRIVERIEQAFSTLDTIDALQAQYADNLTALKSKLIDAAIQGKLTEQLPEDGTAEDLYQQIQAEKQALVQAGKIKKEKPLPEITADEIPFEIPANWKWVRLSDITTTNIGLTYHPEDVVENGTIVVRSSNIINSRMDYTDLVRVGCPIRDNQYLNNNDIVICARNGSKTLVGKCAIYEGKSGKVAFGAFMAVLRTPFYKYVFYYLHTNAFRRYFHSDDSKQINQVTQNILKEALIPLPPLAEQKRIVAKLEGLLPLCEELK